jgi:hypothetical protein
MRHLPSKEYCGLTIVLSQPSRQDLTTLLSGYAGVFFNQDCLASLTSRWRCDIRTADTLGAGLLPNTKAILLLGERSLHEWADGYSEYSINELRGTPLRNKFGVPVICSYSPQDAIDPQDYESKFNSALTSKDEEREGGGEDEVNTKKRHGKTRRANFRFFLAKDVKKILYGMEDANRTKSHVYDIDIYPQLHAVLKVLEETKGSNFYLDIETDSNQNMLCFGFSFEGDTPVYTVPVLRYDYALAYGDSTFRLFRALAKAIMNNTTVVHNSMFDLYVLSTKYSLPFTWNIYDTMLSQHRCFPEAEKSLGHCLSIWPSIWEPFHKDEGIFEPQNLHQEKQLWSYNAKDVAAMKWIRAAQLSYADDIKGLRESIDQSNRSIYPFLLNTLLGMKFDESKRQKMIADNDKLMNGYQRALNYLVGPEMELLATSSKSCVRYFHDALNYPIVGRSKKTEEPSLGEIELLKLKQKFPFNVAIDFCIKYRQRKKETGSLGFTPWKTI